ncbi:inorganic polyphosphate/ATP-NAD kinase [Pelistega indica]|uniref:NAD kinase n=1 Tax=Pelistega indica TaxID=1414851 RepID=V8G3Q8_9BURK|nr:MULTISPECIES: NAD kinase [Pelistega]ETD71164.1 inorganic polyphosphate/ATP-NAD kinase [Pelistega indica]
MHFSIVALIGRYKDSGMDAPLRELAQVLEQANIRVIIEKDTALNTGVKEYQTGSLDQIGQLADLVIVMGGDGTMLGAARDLCKYAVPLLGINHGRLGFITDIPVNDSINAVKSVLDGKFTIEKRTLLEGSIIRDKKVLTTDLALNDIVLSRSGRGGMIEISVDYDNTHMYSQRADGLIVSTPTGSTAYALSANGPIIHPMVEAFLLVPVAPQTLSHRPIAVPSSGMLTLTLSDISRSGGSASVHFDMQTWSDLKAGDKIMIKKASHKVQFLHPFGYSYFSTLRKKLHWNIMPEVSDKP